MSNTHTMTTHMFVIVTESASLAGVHSVSVRAIVDPTSLLCRRNRLNTHAA
jgi:hypothetical protein